MDACRAIVATAGLRSFNGQHSGTEAATEILRAVNEDFLDLLAALIECEARFLVVGAHAMAVHGVPRATGDLDVWVDATPENASRVWHALTRFGAPLEDLGIAATDLEQSDRVVQIGVAPRRIDMLTGVSGLAFGEAWSGRVMVPVGDLSVPFLGRPGLIRNKRATGRLKDLADLDALGDVPDA